MIRIAKFLKIFLFQVKAFLKYPSYLILFGKYFIKSKEAIFLPVSLDIEPNNNCNFRCPHCQVTHWNKETTFLTRENFTRILDMLPSLVSVKLQGMGEPLLNKELIAMLEIGISRGIAMSFFTNGSIYNEDIGRALVGLRNTQIIFSLDGASKDTFERIRVGGNFETVKNTIINLVRARGVKRYPVISVWSVITEENIVELLQIVELSKDLGVDSISLQPFMNNWGKIEMDKYINGAKLDLNNKLTIAKLEEARHRGRELGLNVDIYYGNALSRKNKCSWPWQEAFISSNGDVVPCCILGDPKTIKMGNVLVEDFVKIWYSDKYRDLREKIKKNNIPDFCRHCYEPKDH